MTPRGSPALSAPHPAALNSHCSVMGSVGRLPEAEVSSALPHYTRRSIEVTHGRDWKYIHLEQGEPVPHEGGCIPAL